MNIGWFGRAHNPEDADFYDSQPWTNYNANNGCGDSDPNENTDHCHDTEI